MHGTEKTKLKGPIHDQPQLIFFDESSNLYSYVGSYRNVDQSSVHFSCDSQWNKIRSLCLSRRRPMRFLLELLDLYKTLPALWKVKFEDYHNRA